VGKREDRPTLEAAAEEDDYEDMVTPTDDEGIASLNHTQKIPISLIKAKDKASKLFQPIPSSINYKSTGSTGSRHGNLQHSLISSGVTGDIRHSNSSYYLTSQHGRHSKGSGS